MPLGRGISSTRTPPSSRNSQLDNHLQFVWSPGFYLPIISQPFLLYKQDDNREATANQVPVWIGCSDSRVPETTLLGLQPGDVFVHRNIANVVAPGDNSVFAVVEYAVVHLKVQHIVLCGHTCCGGAAAALGSGPVGGVLDRWLAPLKQVRRANHDELSKIKDDGERAVKLAELNVKTGVDILMSDLVVEEAIKKRGLKVHGVLYDIGSGRIRDLGVGNATQKASSGTGVSEEGEIVKGSHGMLVFKDDGVAMTVR
jgi:carbonic anhydrase